MLDVALKEWAVICDLLAAGELALLLRKGGIYEDAGPGRFKLEHQRFALFPAWEHQQPERIKPAYRSRVAVFDQEPAELTIHAVAEAVSIWQVPSRAAFDRLEDLHPWERSQIDMRFNYKPERPLYLLALRTLKLPQPVVIANTSEYAGCKSWVDLAPDDAIDDSCAEPVLSAVAMGELLVRIEAAMKG